MPTEPTTPARRLTAPETGRPLHLLVLNLPQHGHVNPTLGVVRELVGRGHRVGYATTAAFAPQVAAAGATPFLLEAGRCQAHRAPEDLAEGALLALEDARAALPVLADAFDGDRPDAVLHDSQAYAGPALAHRWGIPAVQLTLTHALYQGWERELYGTADISRHPLFPAFGAFAAEYAPGANPVDFITRPAHSLVFLPRGFQRRPETVSERHRFIGPVIDGRPHQGDWTPPRDGTPVVLIALGSLYTGNPGFYAACMAAFADSGWHVVMAVGHDLDPAALPAAPANVEVHRSVPQLEVLAHASAFVTHAGMGSTMEALSYGVPMVAVPQMAEQRVNAEQIALLGLGRHLPREHANGPALRAAVTEVVADPRVAVTIAATRADLRRYGGAPEAADRVEEVCASADARRQRTASATR